MCAHAMPMASTGMHSVVSAGCTIPINTALMYSLKRLCKLHLLSEKFKNYTSTDIEFYHKITMFSTSIQMNISQMNRQQKVYKNGYTHGNLSYYRVFVIVNTLEPTKCTTSKPTLHELIITHLLPGAIHICLLQSSPLSGGLHSSPCEVPSASVKHMADLCL